ncbi:MAG: response regulator [Deltaproteobacteria bacterium]|nr:response regulator [Deltaproteobacteria bacterium]
MKTKQIMVVEDEKIIAMDIARQLSDLGYGATVTVSSGEEALEKIPLVRPDLVLMDIVLGGEIDGIQTAEKIQKDFDIPVVYLTAYADDKTLDRAKITGPFGYILKPMDKKELHVAVELALYKDEQEKIRKDGRARLERNMKGAVAAIAEAIELRGPYPPGHHRRVSALAMAIAREMELADDLVQGIELTSNVYDMGLVSVPAEFLQNPDRLEGARLQVYQNYPVVGHDILKKIEFHWPVGEIVLQHRERYDGLGFPKKLKSGEILIEARVLAVADAIDDLTTHKSHRNALPLKQALDEVSAKSGANYDPNVIEACTRLIREKDYRMED